MNETMQHETELILRRLTEEPELFGYPLDFSPLWWLALALPLLVLALVLTYWMYRKDTKAVGWAWGGFLSLLRTATYLSIFGIWLLPAIREIELTTQHSRVLLLFDVSGSLQTSDDPATDNPNQVRNTRQELILEALQIEDPAVASAAKPGFLQRLAAKNPLHCYRYGERLDPNDWQVTPERWLRPFDWSRKLQLAPRPTLSEVVPLEVLQEFERAGQRFRRLEGLDETARERQQREIVEDFERGLAEQQQIRDRLLNRTNLGEALLNVLRKESGNMVQGMIVFSDGRMNAGSSQDLAEAVRLARNAKIPVFTVGVGQHRETINLRLTDVLAPAQVQPEDEFPVRVAVEAENVPKQQEITLELTVQKPSLPEVKLTQKVTLTETTARLATGTAEFRITNPDKIKGDWKFRGRAVAIKGERTRSDNVSEEPTTVKVVDRKLSVLLFANRPSRDYQFLRTLLVREKDKFDLSIYLQSAQSGVVQDVDAKRLLDQFPNDLRDRNGDPLNLGNYDVVVAFDPDWRALEPAVRDQLRKWVEDFAGGLIVEAGHVHTFTLARDKELATIRALYPVELDATASSFTMMDRSAKDPWALNWGPTAAQLPFLDLTESGDKTKVLEGWEQFFDAQRNPGTGVADLPAKRGFFAFFPLVDRKPTADVLARFSDPKALTPRGERQPYLVIHTVRKGQVFYIGSGELYRLRGYSEKFHERFWTKLLRHMGRGEMARGTRRGLLMVGSRFVEGDMVEAEAQLLDAEMRPLKIDPKEKVTLRVQPPEGVSDMPREWLTGLEMKPIPGRAGWFVARFPVRRVGKYTVQVDIPGSREMLNNGFRVEATDPERDQTRPDFALLHRLATEFRDAELPNESNRPEILRALTETRELVKRQVKEAPQGSMTLTPENEQERLFFVLGQNGLSTSQWIPECLDSNVVPFRAEGKVTDLWDKGWTVFRDIHHPETAEGPPWALVLIVSLVSVEWLTRKLLKLA